MVFDLNGFSKSEKSFEHRFDFQDEIYPPLNDISRLLMNVAFAKRNDSIVINTYVILNILVISLRNGLMIRIIFALSSFQRKNL